MFASTVARVKYVAIASAIGLIAPVLTGTQASAIDLDREIEELYTTAGSDPSDYIVDPGEGLDGVADLILGGSRCTGTLLPTGAHILTAAHCVTDDFGIQDVFSGTATFELPTGDISLSIENFFINPDWTATIFAGNDIAILELEDTAPDTVERYEIYRDVDEVGHEGHKVGYGRSGTGLTGAVFPSGIKREGQNLYDSTGSLFSAAEELLVYDFDNGLGSNDGFGFFFGGSFADLGLGLDEVSAAPGDSGGPTFIDGQIAGVTSFGARFRFPSGASSDIDGVLNSTFGEFGFDTRVSSYAAWIDEILDMPHEKEKVPEPSSLAGLMILGTGLLLKRKAL